VNDEFDNLKLVNCAECERELTAPNQDGLIARLKKLHGGEAIPAPMSCRVAGRPYCGTCIKTRINPSRGYGGGRTPRQSGRASEGDDNPWLGKATRDAEDSNS
jgi:hypothetical protein